MNSWECNDLNVPVSLLGMFLIGAFVKDPSYLRRGIRKIDWGGIGLLAVALTGLQIILERGQAENWFESNLITTGAVITGVTAPDFHNISIFFLYKINVSPFSFFLKKMSIMLSSCNDISS